MKIDRKPWGVMLQKHWKEHQNVKTAVRFCCLQVSNLKDALVHHHEKKVHLI